MTSVSFLSLYFYFQEWTVPFGVIISLKYDEEAFLTILLYRTSRSNLQAKLNAIQL